MFHAQDHNMTNGDFAFFTFEPVRHARSDRPWIGHVQDPDDIARRRRAFYAVKQASAIGSLIIIIIIIYCRNKVHNLYQTI